jgi:hypothetical protein
MVKFKIEGFVKDEDVTSTPTCVLYHFVTRGSVTTKLRGVDSSDFNQFL